MTKFLIALFILIQFFTACKNGAEKDSSTRPRQSVITFSWLNGKWVMPEKDGIITEEWKQINDSLMEGKSDFVKGDSVIPFETIRIFRKDTLFYYEAKAAGQNNEKPVAFTLTSFSDIGFIAENPQHDFPKRISYTLVNKDSIHAFIDGGPQQSGKKADFFYSRKK